MTTTSLPTAPEIVAQPPRSPAATSLLTRLDDPRTAAALHDLLDNVELLAMAVTMVDGLLRRSETLTSNLAGSLSEVRTAAAGDLQGDAVQEGLAALRTVRDGLPAVQALLAGRLARPETIAALDTLSGALVDGLAQVRAAPAKQSGVRSLLGELRDPATARGLAMLLSVARSLGRRG